MEPTSYIVAAYAASGMLLLWLVAASLLRARRVRQRLHRIDTL